MIEALLTALYQMENYFQSGGVIMLPLALVSLLMWVLIVNRVLHFRRLHRKNMDSRTAREHIQENKLPDPKQYRGVVSLLVAEFMHNKSGNPALDRFILDESVFRINRCLEDYLGMIGALAAVAPLLGLSGTVLGMLVSFEVISVFGTGNAQALSGGISEALITTQTGLLVAIPGLYMKGFLQKRAQNLKKRNAVIGYYLRRQM